MGRCTRVEFAQSHGGELRRRARIAGHDRHDRHDRNTRRQLVLRHGDCREDATLRRIALEFADRVMIFSDNLHASDDESAPAHEARARAAGGGG